MGKSKAALLFLIVAISALANATVVHAEISTYVYIDSSNIVYDPVLKIAQSRSRTSVSVGNGSIYADNVQVDYKNNILFASGNIIFNSYYSGDEMIVNIKYGDAALYIEPEDKRPLYFALKEGQELVSQMRNADSKPSFAVLPERNVIHCSSISYMEPGMFRMSHAYYIDMDGGSHYAARIMSDSPDLSRNKVIADFSIQTIKTSSIISNNLRSDYGESERWLSESAATELWLTNSFGRSSWIDLTGKIDPETGRSYISPRVNYNATFKNRNLYVYTQQSQENDIIGGTLYKYNDSRGFRGLSIQVSENEYFVPSGSSPTLRRWQNSSSKRLSYSWGKGGNKKTWSVSLSRDITSRDSESESLRKFENIRRRSYVSYQISDWRNNSVNNHISSSYSILPVKAHKFPMFFSLSISGDARNADSYNHDEYISNRFFDSGSEDSSLRASSREGELSEWTLSFKPSLSTGVRKITTSAYYGAYVGYSATLGKTSSEYSDTRYNELLIPATSSNISTLTDINKVNSKRDDYTLTSNGYFYKRIGERSSLGVIVSTSQSSFSSTDIYPYYSYSNRNGSYYEVKYDYDTKKSMWDNAVLKARILKYGRYRYVGLAQYDFYDDKMSSASHVVDIETNHGVYTLSYTEPRSELMIKYQASLSHGENRGGALDGYSER